MATGILALLDDVASVLDDVAVMTKVAAKKTTGVIGDDLALNAEQMNGISAEKEIPIIWAVCKGSFVNKLILVPVAMIISYFVPALVIPLLMIGGAYLCFEGVEKVLEKVFHTHKNDIRPALSESEKIKGAIRTDFILSAEIIVISLGSIKSGSFIGQLLTLSLISIIMTIGVYGFVALIIKLDDMGLWLHKKESKIGKKVGFVLLNSAPYLMKALGLIGTVAMFLVGGGIISHGIPALGHWFETVLSVLNSASLRIILGISFEGFIGVVTGFIVLGLVSVVSKVKKK
jgi:predicted DNA repair protein MutK